MLFSLRAPSFVLVSTLLIVACDDDTKKRPIGATCTEDEECQGGVCGGGLCLDPELDTDLDGLINRIEAGLDTDPVAADTDGDGIPDGVEVGPDPNRPLDTDGDGRVDALESVTADCDRDQRPDQLDADDGLDAEGICRGSVVISPCQDLCARAQALQCSGAAVGCLTSCSETFTDLSADCRGKFAAAGACVADAEVAGCAFGDQPAWQLEVADGVCGAEIEAVSPCLEGGGIPCSAATPLALDAVVSGSLASQTSLVAYAVQLEANGLYELVVTPTSALDDPSIAVFDSTSARCAWLANPVGGTLPTAVSDEPAGNAERIELDPGDAPSLVDILVVNARADGPTSYTIQVRVMPQ